MRVFIIITLVRVKLRSEYLNEVVSRGEAGHHTILEGLGVGYGDVEALAG